MVRVSLTSGTSLSSDELEQLGLFLAKACMAGVQIEERSQIEEFKTSMKLPHIPVTQLKRGDPVPYDSIVLRLDTEENEPSNVEQIARCIRAIARREWQASVKEGASLSAMISVMRSLDGKLSAKVRALVFNQ